MTTVEFQVNEKGMAHTKYITDLKTNHSNCIPDEELVTLKLKMALSQLFLAECLPGTFWPGTVLEAIIFSSIGGHITIIISLYFYIDTYTHIISFGNYSSHLREARGTENVSFNLEMHI